MQRFTIRSPLWALLSGLVLSACGTPEEGLTPQQETVGSQESALCSGVSVSSLTVAGVSTYQGEMAGSGNWAVSAGANAIRLEYYVDGALKYYEERLGTSGTWYFSYGGITCGTHSFQVKAVPMVVDSAGTRTTCSSSPTSSSLYYPAENCPTPVTTLSCSRYSTTQIRCTATASQGTGSYTPYWQEYYTLEAWESGWYSGSWTQYFYCSATSSCLQQQQADSSRSTKDVSTQRLPPGDCEPYGYDRVQFQFKVIDSAGAQSVVRSSTTYTCYY